jgi:hypothetical protein
MNSNGSNKRLSSKLEIDYPDFAKLPEAVRQKYDSSPTVVNIFRMLGYLYTIIQFYGQRKDGRQMIKYARLNPQTA